MANNRMYLVCNVCQPKETKLKLGSKGSLTIAKWYPASHELDIDGAYYTTRAPADFKIKFFDFLEQHQHREVASHQYKKGAGQPNPIRIEYEVDDLPNV